MCFIPFYSGRTNSGETEGNFEFMRKNKISQNRGYRNNGDHVGINTSDSSRGIGPKQGKEEL